MGPYQRLMLPGDVASWPLMIVLTLPAICIFVPLSFCIRARTSAQVQAPAMTPRDSSYCVPHAMRYLSNKVWISSLCAMMFRSSSVPIALFAKARIESGTFLLNSGTYGSGTGAGACGTIFEVVAGTETFRAVMGARDMGVDTVAAAVDVCVPRFGV